MAEQGGDLEELIQDAKLPFEVEVPEADQEKTLKKIVKRQGKDIEAIKHDHNFDSFLKNLLREFDETKKEPEHPQRSDSNPDSLAKPESIVRPSFAYAHGLDKIV